MAFTFFKKAKRKEHPFREELDDHLDSINQNTNEIQSNYEYVCRLEAKMEALCERVSTLQIRLNEIDQETGSNEKINLSYEEKKVFLAIYKYASEKNFISYSEIGKRLGVTISLVRFYITNLIEKNIPIIKKYRNREVLVSLDSEFREKQAKENVVNINESITSYI